MIGKDIHPTETAGDGRLEPRRTTYVPGEKIVDLVRCAQCGMINRVGMDTEGDSSDSPGITQVPTAITVVLQNKNLPQPLKGMSEFSKASVQISDPKVQAGCRFCGSLNWRGKDRNLRDYGSGIDMRNR